MAWLHDWMVHLGLGVEGRPGCESPQREYDSDCGKEVGHRMKGGAALCPMVTGAVA